MLINLKSDNPNSRKLARYDFSKLNLTESITLEQVTEEIKVLQEELGYYLDQYEGLTRRLETLVKILSTKTYRPKISRRYFSRINKF